MKVQKPTTGYETPNDQGDLRRLKRPEASNIPGNSVGITSDKFTSLRELK